MLDGEKLASRTMRRGAVTTDVFAEFFAHWCQWIRNSLQIPLSEEVCLMLVFAGGSMSHFVAELGVLSLKYKIHSFYLARYHTAAVLALDQSPNKEFERCWNQIRAKERQLFKIASARRVSWVLGPWLQPEAHLERLVFYRSDSRWLELCVLSRFLFPELPKCKQNTCVRVWKDLQTDFLRGITFVCRGVTSCAMRMG